MLKLDDSLSCLLEAGDQVVVGSRQRAVAIRLGHAAAQLRRGVTAWRTPAVDALGRWQQAVASRLRAAGAPVPRALGPHEEWLLWSEAAAELTADAALLLPDAIADGLARAARLAAEHGITAAAIAADGSDEARWLARAEQHVARRAEALGAIPRHELWSVLAAVEPDVLRGRAVHFTGLGKPTPALLRLAERWGERGVALRWHAPRAPRALVRVVAAGEPLDELRLAAEWCAGRLAQDPEARLLLVVPDLARRRLQLDRVLRETLEPAACLDRAASPASFGFEGGGPLADYPLPRAALELFALLTRPVAPARVQAVLEARFWPAGSGAGRARAARWLRGRGGGTMEPRDLLQAFASACAGDPACEALAGRLRAASSAWPVGRLESAGWANAFAQALETLCWPGSGTADSAGQQALEGWRALLQQFADLGAALGSCAAGRAVDVLAAMARRESFAPLGADVPVLVTAALEDPVVDYDGIWVCGLQADRWPQPARLDPYVPWTLQRRAGVEAATPAGALAVARRALAAWQGATDELCLSWAQRDEEAELAPSPLLAAWPAQQSAPVLPPLAARLRAMAPAAIEDRDDTRGAPWPAGRALPRGVRALELQNLCPFRAYAEIRLGAEPPRPPQPGISAFERGEYLHRVLELAWAELGGSAALAAHDAGALGALVARAAERALEVFARPGRANADARSVQRERERALEVVGALLARERERTPFRVLAREWELDGEIDGAPLRLRIDRVDVFDDGRLAIVDYKTGMARPLDWLGDRAEPVQLFTYALALQQRGAGAVAALGNVHLVRRGKSYSAMTEADDLLPDSRVAFDWAQLLGQWRGQVERLARAFVRGEARVEPLTDACKRCHLQGCCRRAELGVGGGAGG